VKPKVEPIANLLALKRHERPEKGYWEDFLSEFHQRQSETPEAVSGAVSPSQRLNLWFDQLGPSKWAYAAGIAYAVATIVFFLAPRQVDEENTPASSVKFQIVPAPAPVPTPRVTQPRHEPNRNRNTSAPPLR
jgi:hypothetical protein